MQKEIIKLATDYNDLITVLVRYINEWGKNAITESEIVKYGISNHYCNGFPAWSNLLDLIVFYFIFLSC